MNDFSELENELKKLRPRAASPDLAMRIERALAESPSATPTAGLLPHRGKFRLNWLSLGLGLAAAAVFLLLARVDSNRRPPGTQRSLAALSPAPVIRAPSASGVMIPAGLTRVVYGTRDEGLHFPGEANEPVRRVRTQTRETLQWRNPQTGASLRVSYPSEEVLLTPVLGQ